MKAFLTSISLLLFTCSFAQLWFDEYPLDSIHFESASPYLALDTMNESNLWQISPPNKTVLNTAVSPTHVIITDSLNPYAANNHSYFDVLLTNQNVIWFPEFQVLKFKHRICTDTLRDGGYITLSCDMGETWTNIIDPDPCIYADFYPGDGDWDNYRNLYTETDTLFNGEKGFSGCMTEWEEVIIDWGFWPVAPPPGQDVMDTLLLRFNFISDNLDNPFDGWMIDDIEFMYATLPGSTNNRTKAVFELFPNPSQTGVNIKLDAFYNEISMQIFNLHGQPILQKSNLQGEQIRLDYEGHFTPGIYFLQLRSGTKSLGTQKFMVR